MNMLWLLPPVLLIGGLAAVLVMLRSIEGATDDIRRQLKGMGEVHLAVARVRAETARARTSREQLHRR